MKRTIKNNLATIIPDEGKWLYNEQIGVFSNEVTLPKNADVSIWQEVTESYKTQKEQERAIAIEYAQMPEQSTVLEDVRTRKIAELEAFDSEESPEGVNWFYAGSLGMWIKKADRSGLSLSINAAEICGRTSIALWIGDTRIDLPLATARQMLCALELYASECYGVTAAHRAAINALTAAEDIETYNFKTGYPDKLTFNI